MFWKDHQHEFPALASLARDILSVPATGGGVERIFNISRDICHYRRGSLKPETIRELMMHRCTTKFEAQDEFLALKKEYLSTEEIEIENEEKDPLLQDYLNLISDNEEDENEVFNQEQLIPEGLSERAAGKRRKSIVSEPEIEPQQATISDDEAINPLPDTQQRVSRRIRKRSRRDDDQFIEY
jgi:hypothetical protein